MSTDRPIVIYHYKFSPYARRIQWYLAIRGLEYTECIQPPILPRPDINSLGVAYRRIPVLAIGRDVYLDTRLQLSKMESSPHLAAIAPPLSPPAETSESDKFITRLVDKWSNDTGLFLRGASLIPPDLPVVKDPRFQRDRQDFFAAPFSSTPEERAESLAEVKSFFTLLESQLSSPQDGKKRDWILGTRNPSMADIEAIWLPHWLVLGLPGALNSPVSRKPYITEDEFPAVWAWIKRFDGLVKERQKAKSPGRVDGDRAREMVVRSAWNEEWADTPVDGNDALTQALGLKKGDGIEVNPTDTGKNHKDVGSLVGINEEEVIWEATTKEGHIVKVHVPRHGYRIRKAGRGSKL